MTKDWIFDAIGTKWQIALPGLSEEEAENVVTRALERIVKFDRAYSRFRDDSLVMEMARAAGTYTLPDDAEPMFDLYKYLYDMTEGKYTPLIGQVLSDAGYDAEYSLTPRALTVAQKWDDVLTYSFPELTLSQPALLDFGAAGKGYLVDIIAEQFLAAGVDSFCINAGGDIRYADASGASIGVGLEHPDDATKVIGVANIQSGSICGSAGNRRAWGTFHHIIDPDDLVSPKHIRAVWVTAPTALVADALTTCLYFLTPDILASRLGSEYPFEYLIIRDDYSFDRSAGFPAELYTA